MEKEKNLNELFLSLREGEQWMKVLNEEWEKASTLEKSKSFNEYNFFKIFLKITMDQIRVNIINSYNPYY